MKATLILEGKWKVSKQNSYCARPRGGKFKNPAYAAEQHRMLVAIRPQLAAQGWRCTENPVALLITFCGPCMPVDWDNCGLLTDALQGPTLMIRGKRIRQPGPVVVDDRQFCPVTVKWHKCAERKIIIEMEEQQNEGSEISRENQIDDDQERDGEEGDHPGAADRDLRQGRLRPGRAAADPQSEPAGGKPRD